MVGCAMAKSNREYPRQVWVLMPSFKPVQVTVVKPYDSWSSVDYGDLTDAGKLYGITKMFASLDDAISAGRRGLSAQEVKIALMSEKIQKKRTALDKAEGKKP